MKSVRFIPVMAGLLFSSQVLAADPQSRATDSQLRVAVQSAVPASESQQAPVVLTAAEMDRITAGVGRDNVGNEAWGALLDVGFSLHHNLNSDQGVQDHAGHIGVAVPSTVPNSVCVAFC